MLRAPFLCVLFRVMCCVIVIVFSFVCYVCVSSFLCSFCVRSLFVCVCLCVLFGVFFFVFY